VRTTAIELGATLAERYAIERELGRGGMATVYLALDLRLQRPVALKVLRPELAASLGNQRFLREIEIAALLSHPHILPLHESGQAGGHLYYSMPYVEGESLRQKLEREGQLSIAEVIAILQAVASALTYAHQLGIVHRDIKPENILLDRHAGDGAVHPLVADFGIARGLDIAGGERLTETGLALGTPAYMSPEQATVTSRLDGRSDIYALGCVAYEMLSGQPPFTGPSAQAILARHAVDPIPPLHTVRSTVPEAVEAAVERALAKVPADRYSTAAEFADALTSERPEKPIRPRSRNRRLKLASGIVAGALALGAGAVMLRGFGGSAVIPSAATMAVLPLISVSPDTMLGRLGRDLAVTISASLDGVGEIETADRLMVANATADKQGLSSAEAAAVAQRLGASSFLRGTLVGAGDHVRLDLGLYTTVGLEPLAEGITVSGHRDSIGTLTDSASWALLRQVWQRGEPPSPSLAEVTTRSLPALRAFLEGERELGGNNWQKAALAFRSAITSDSTFGLAHFRYALAEWWIPDQQPLEPEVMAPLRRYRSSLSERERLLVDAFLTTADNQNTTRLQIDRYRAVAERFPNYWPAWFLYADALHHSGPRMGYDWFESIKAFRRVVALNPKLIPAWEHMSDQAIGKSLAVVLQARSQLAKLGWPPPQNRMLGLTSRFDPEVFRAGGVIPPSLDVLADSLADYIVSPGDEGFSVIYGPLGTLVQGFPAAQIDLNERALRLSKVTPEVATALRAAKAWSWAARGQWDSALTIMSGISAEQPTELGIAALPVEQYAMAVLGCWLGVTPLAAAVQRRPIAAASIERITDARRKRHNQARLAWLDGLLGFARRDSTAIEAARRQAIASAWYQADVVDRSLAAFDRALAGDRSRAGQDLAALEEHCLDNPNCSHLTPPIGVHRLAAAQWLHEAGDLDRAARLLRWQENGSLLHAWGWTSTYALDAPAYLVRARIEQSRGQDSLAQEYYNQFLRRYDSPMPSQVHLVQEARDALARIQEDH
jgi:tetratricopeptide (TPR) repeat protein